ncbi:hypothetical protein E4T43_04920 [Aureobasidium subglaciale]|nr:hypothetical protein E4T43_04920 [Aureobasidium subglaciale]
MCQSKDNCIGCRYSVYQPFEKRLQSGGFIAMSPRLTFEIMTPLVKQLDCLKLRCVPLKRFSRIHFPPRVPLSFARTFKSTTSPNMRIPYAPTEPAADASETTKAVYERITERRKPRPLLPLDLALLHNTAIADGWNSLLGAVRSKTSLNPGLMEMAVCRIAVLNKATFEWISHAPLALKGGLPRASLDLVRTAGIYPPGGRSKTKEEQETFSDQEWAVLCYADQVTKNVEVDDEVFDALRKFLDNTGIMEMTAAVATYNMVSRFLVAMNVSEKNGHEIVMPEE